MLLGSLSAKCFISRDVLLLELPSMRYWQNSFVIILHFRSLSCFGTVETGFLGMQLFSHTGQGL